MNKNILYLFFLLYTCPLFAQNIDSFRLDFQRALLPDFSQARLVEMVERHTDLMNLYTIAQADPDWRSGEPYPLLPFRHDSLYINNLNTLLSSDSTSHRALAFLIIGAAGDSAMTGALLQKMKVETDPILLNCGGLSLIWLGCQETTPIFDLIVKHDDIGSGYFWNAYFSLNKDSLLHTGLNRINSTNKTARRLAAYSLGFASKTKANEAALRKAVHEWDINEKGYAISSLKQLKVGNLDLLLKPLLYDPLTQNIALEALLESPSSQDFQAVKRYIEKDDPISIELLTPLYKSSKPKVIEYWLYLLRTKKLSAGSLHCPVYDQPILTSDAFLPLLHKTLKKSQNPQVLQYLSRALKGRTDKKSVQLIVQLLRHPDPGTRYWTARWNTNCKSSLLAREIPALLADTQNRVLPLVDMAIANEIDTLQSLFEGIYWNNPTRDWEGASLKYLAAFPKPHHVPIFQKFLKPEEAFSTFNDHQHAAIGLGRLGHVESDELIIKSSHKWRVGSDYNIYNHLLALKMLKTEKAKLEFQYYLDCQDLRIREFAKQTLENW